MELAAGKDIDPALMHRVAVIGSGTLDSLPQTAGPTGDKEQRSRIVPYANCRWHAWARCSFAITPPIFHWLLCCAGDRKS
jgi:hypothetical protein